VSGIAEDFVLELRCSQEKNVCHVRSYEYAFRSKECVCKLDAPIRAPQRTFRSAIYDGHIRERVQLSQ